MTSMITVEIEQINSSEETMADNLGKEAEISESEAEVIVEGETNQPDTIIVTRKKTGKIGKVGRPVTSPRTLAARNFPPVPEIMEKLESGECYARMKSSHASSEVWTLFEEIAYTDNAEFTGIVRCKNCHFMTRFHGQITGTSHMRRHPCFGNMSSDGTSGNNENFANRSERGLKTYSRKYCSVGSSQGNYCTKRRDRNSVNALLNQSTGGDDTPMINWQTIYDKFVEVKDAITSDLIGYLSCKECKALIKRDIHTVTQHSCKTKDIARKNATQIETSCLLFRMKPKSRATPIWDIFEEIIDPTTNTVIGYVRCKQCKTIIRATDPKSIPSVLRKHIPNCSAECQTNQPTMILPHGPDMDTGEAHYVQILPCSPTNNQSSSSAGATTTSISIAQQSSSSTPTTSSPSKSSLRSIIPSALALTMGPPSSAIKTPPSSSSNTKIINAKADFREKVIQFCSSELVALEAVTSESFKRLAQSLVSLGAQYGRSTLVLPDFNQLQARMNVAYSQVKNQIKTQLDSEINRNMGGTLVCDAQDSLCILSAHYINNDWQLVESVLSATTSIGDINSFISAALNDYGINEEEKLTKFTFVSRGGLFDGVNICLASVAHIIDHLVESAIFNDDTIVDIIENCRLICSELKIDIKLEQSIQNVVWLYKWELMNNVILNRDNFEMQNSTLDFDLIKNLVDLLAIFKEASYELRQCNRHPTSNHVLLWYHKLLKICATSSESALDEASFLNSIKSCLKLAIEQHFQLHNLHKIATFLWPNFRFLKMLTDEEREQVHAEVRSYIESRGSSDEPFGSSTTKRARSDFSDWEDSTDDGIDEVEKYVTAMLTSCNESNLLQWWKEHQNDFPKLSNLAKWILSIPASVTSLEKFKLYSTQKVNDELLFLYCNSKRDYEEKKLENVKKKTNVKLR